MLRADRWNAIPQQKLIGHSVGFILTLALAFAPVHIARAQSTGAFEGGVTKWTPPSADPKDFEGVWLPSMGPPPSAATKATDGPPKEIGGLFSAGASGQPPGVPPGGGTAPSGGGVPPGAPPVAASGTTLQCAPVDRQSGAGGGLANLLLQDSHEIAWISEENQDVARKIYLNVKTHPQNLVLQPNGHSIGHWEGNILVVDSIGYSNPDGTPRDLHRIEHFHKEGNFLVDDVTNISSGQTQHQTVRQMWRSDLHVFENICEENYNRYQVVGGEVINPNLPPTEEH